MLYNEDTRVKFPALVHFTRLGYEYVSLQCNKECFDPETNIHIHTFCNAINRINNTQIDIKEAKKIIKELGLNSSNFDLGFLFYENLIKGYKGKKIIDFSQNDKNIYQIITEYSYIKDKDKFRPDITVLINGIPIAFVEVKKPNNTKGIQAEVERMSNRLRNENFRQFFNMFQIMVFSNNSEYDEREAVPTQGAFYSTTAKDKIILNYFREEHYQELVNSLMPIDKEKEKLILKDNNCLSILSSPEYKTNIDPGTPTNRIISSLFYKERLKMFLKYGIVYVRKTLNTGIKKLEKHIMRYPQLFATQAIKAKLDAGEKKGIIWHTQGSGKTALAYYNIKVLKDYFQDKGIIAQFYFIVDRISLANQAEEEFRSRGIQVNLIRDIKHFENYISNNIEASNNHGEDSVVVVNIQKFSDKSIVKDSSYNTNIQRVYFIDEAHRSYNPSGCFLAHLFCSDKNAIKIALTGTPLIGAVYDKQGQYIKGKKYDSKQIFGQYIHKYYYNKSIKDRYTLRLIREEILTTYKESLLNTLKELKIKHGSINKNKLFAHPSYVKKLVKYIIEDFKINKEQDIGAMIVCDSSDQARAVFKEMENSEFKTALILSDNNTGRNEDRIHWQNDFKKGDINFLIVYNMLLTGFDAPRLKRLYLGRVIKDHSLLQTLTRVNRPYEDFRYGYVIDFADISKEFDKTNQAYLNELQKELGDEFNKYSNMIKSREEVESDLNYIKNILFRFNIKNAEEFSKQISNINDKEELRSIHYALQLYKELYNIVKLYEYNELVNLFDLEKINHLSNEVSLRINLLNYKEMLQDPNTMDMDVLSTAMENITFNFTKVKEHELYIADEFKDSIKKVQKELESSQDTKDSEYTTLYHALKEILSRKNIEELTYHELELNINEINKVYDKVRILNQQNFEITSKYKGDPKFMRVHKIIQQKQLIDSNDIHTFLLEVKEQVDNRLLNNEAEIDNEKLFEGRIKDIIKANKLKLDANKRTQIALYIANEYQDERSNV